MKILTISNYFPNHVGGIEIVAQNLVEQWRKEHTVHWAACEVESWNGSKEDDVPLKAWNITETHLGFPYPIPSFISVLKILNEVRWCDIVHLHDCLYLSNIIAFLFAKVFAKPICITQHISVVPYQEKYKVLLQLIAYKTLGRMLLKGSNEVVFINEATRKWFASAMKLRKTFVFQNGVDHKIFFPVNTNHEKTAIRRELGYSENDFILLFIGRFTQKKGVDIIRKIAAALPDYKWLMVGGGDVPVSKWDLRNVESFPQQVQNDLRKFYVAADLFVLPSQGEGFPLSVQEALTCGLPAAVSREIATSLPDAPLISLDTDSINSVIKKLGSIAGQPNALSDLRKLSIAYSEKWNWDLIAKKYLRNFEAIIQNNPYKK